MTRHLLSLWILVVPAAARTAEPQPIAGVYTAEAVKDSPLLTASGMAWWRDRLVIADRVPKELKTFTPPGTFEVFKTLSHPVGVAVDPQGNLIVTEKDPNVLYRVARFKPDGSDETLVKGTMDVKATPDGVGTPHFVAVHPNGTIYWSGFPDGGTRYLLPGAKDVTIALPRIVHTYGIGLSPKHDWLYVNSKIPNPDRRGVWRFPVDKEGKLGEGEFFIQIDQFKTSHLKDLPAAKDGSDSLKGWVGRLQGLAVDRLGYIYVGGAESHTSGSAVAVFTPDGKTLAAMIVGVPTNISGLAFGGKDGRTLFITGAGEYRLHQVQLPVAGEVFRQPADTRHRIELPLKMARSRDPVLGGSREKVFVAVWIPEGVKTVRGALCNPFSKDEPVSKHWQAACRHWGFAYVQTDFDAVNKAEFSLLATGLNELARTTGHPELATMPLCFTGMSRGGGMSMNLTEMMPERTLASVPVCLEVGPTTEASRRVPVMTVFGEKDGSQMEKLLAKLPIERKESARWGIAVQWNRKHEFGQANNLSFVFLDEVIRRRLPKEPGAKLADIPLEDGWLGDIATWKADGSRPTIAAWKDFTGDRAQASWFPSRRVATTWQAFVSGSKDVTIAEPAGLGDGQAFATLSAARPVTVKVNVDAKITVTKVELWDADVKLAEKTTGPWTFEVPLKAGVHSLVAVVHQDGKTERGSRPHTVVVGE